MIRNENSNSWDRGHGMYVWSQALCQGILTPGESERMRLRLENGSPRKKRKRKSSRTRARDRERVRQAVDFLEGYIGQTSPDVFFRELPWKSDLPPSWSICIMVSTLSSSIRERQRWKEKQRLSFTKESARC